ncbi:hypothetical protein DRN63_04095 [Nanoarchaeota archaeon]|nr:MAG: hypothetical protein DRN63_04095 [Nanoarchaeota archaeon]
MPYKVIKLDLSTTRTGEIVLEVEHEIKRIIVTRADSESYIHLDHPKNDPIYCSQRLKIEYPCKSIYVTNPAGSGYLELFVQW